MKYSHILCKIFLYNIPISLLLILIAEDLIFVLLGPSWMDIVIYFQILAIGALTFPIHPLTMVPLKVFDRASQILRLEIVKKIVLISMIFVTINLGFIYLVLGQSVYFLIILPINMYFGGKIIEYPLKDQFKDIVPYLFSGFLAFCITLGFNSISHFSSYLSIIISILLFFSIYVVLLRIILKETFLIIFKISL